MSMPFYVSPEQIMKDKSDYARKGIARGRSVLALQYVDGLLFVGENPNGALHKISEIYDRIAFAAVGKYNEFESLRQAGVRYADVRGYSYNRGDVTARGLASVYAQSLGAVFTADTKPFEVELAVVEVGTAPAEDHLYRLTFDGSIADEKGFVVMGGHADSLSEALRGSWQESMDFPEVIRAAVAALSGGGTSEGPEPGSRRLEPDLLEIAVLDRDPL